MAEIKLSFNARKKRFSGQVDSEAACIILEDFFDGGGAAGRPTEGGGVKCFEVVPPEPGIVERTVAAEAAAAEAKIKAKMREKAENQLFQRVRALTACHRAFPLLSPPSARRARALAFTPNTACRW